jgi:hypothetical protein
MGDPHALPSLFQGVFVPVDLRKDGTVLHLELAHDLELLHAVGDALLLQIELISWQKVKCLFNALGTLIKHLHLLIA